MIPQTRCTQSWRARCRKALLKVFLQPFAHAIQESVSPVKAAAIHRAVQTELRDAAWRNR